MSATLFSDITKEEIYYDVNDNKLLSPLYVPLPFPPVISSYVPLPRPMLYQFLLAKYQIKQNYIKYVKLKGYKSRGQGLDGQMVSKKVLDSNKERTTKHKTKEFTTKGEDLDDNNTNNNNEDRDIIEQNEDNSLQSAAATATTTTTAAVEPNKRSTMSSLLALRVTPGSLVEPPAPAMSPSAATTTTTAATTPAAATTTTTTTPASALVLHDQHGNNLVEHTTSLNNTFARPAPIDMKSQQARKLFETAFRDVSSTVERCVDINHYSPTIRQTHTQAKVIGEWMASFDVVVEVRGKHQSTYHSRAAHGTVQSEPPLHLRITALTHNRHTSMPLTREQQQFNVNQCEQVIKQALDTAQHTERLGKMIR